jgi:cysteinyl-tRNA synthetase
MFDMVREANAAADAAKVFRGDLPHLLGALGHFDEIFDVLEDRDAPKIQRALEWARAEGKQPTAGLDLPALGDADVDSLIAERATAKKSRNFARADAIRAQLADAGIILEDTKDGVRWKRK